MVRKLYVDVLTTENVDALMEENVRGNYWGLLINQVTRTFVDQWDDFVL